MLAYLRLMHNALAHDEQEFLDELLKLIAALPEDIKLMEVCPLGTGSKLVEHDSGALGSATSDRAQQQPSKWQAP